LTASSRRCACPRWAATASSSASIRCAIPSRPRAPALAPEIRRRLHGLATDRHGRAGRGQGLCRCRAFSPGAGMGRHSVQGGGSDPGGAAAGTIEVLPGKAVLEIKPAAFSKGTAIRELMAVAPFRGRRPSSSAMTRPTSTPLPCCRNSMASAFPSAAASPGLQPACPAPSDVRHWLARI
jgi:hypothetical protein